MSGKRILIFSFIVGIVLVFIGRIIQLRLRHESFTPQESTFSFKPPRRAVQGKVRATIGDVKKHSRDADKLEKINVAEPVLQGDKIVTGKNAAVTVQLADIGIMNIKGDSVVNSISLVPANMLIQQVNGNVTYESTANNVISVRSMHALFTLQSGTGTVATDKNEGQIIVSVTEGIGKLAMIDTDNKTHTWELKTGQKATVDDEARTVKVSK